MSFHLYINDGTTRTEFTLPSVGYVLEYDVGVPNKEVQEETRPAFDGGDITGSSKRNYTGSFQVLLVGGESAIRSLLGTLKQQSEQVDTFQQYKIEPRVYLEFEKDDVDQTWRSELISLRIAPEPDWLTTLAVSGTAKVRFFYTRRYYWEGEEAAVPLSNGNGSNNTLGLTIYNHNDSTAGHDNYVDISPVAIDGDLPAPIRLEITNTYASSNRSTKFWIAHQARTAIAANSTILEGESGAVVAPYCTVVGGLSGICSNAGVMRFSWTPTTEVNLTYWALSTTLLNAAKGGYFRGLVVFGGGTPANLYLQFRISLDDIAAGPIWASEWTLVPTSGQILEIATMQLPPYLAYGGGVAQLRLQLWAKCATAGAKSFDLDFVHLMPLESWRALKDKGSQVAQGVTLVIDDILGQVYTTGWSVAGKYGNYIANGSPLSLVPGYTNRLYFLVQDDNSGYKVDRTHVIVAAYRPRKQFI